MSETEDTNRYVQQAIEAVYVASDEELLLRLMAVAMRPIADVRAALLEYEDTPPQAVHQQRDGVLERFVRDDRRRAARRFLDTGDLPPDRDLEVLVDAVMLTATAPGAVT